MKKNIQKRCIVAGALFLAFGIFTGLVACFDVQPIGPEQSQVGFATVNQFVFRMIGVQFMWYHITGWLGIAAASLIAVTVMGRLLSGVHWFTDIVGGLLLSAALVTLYGAVAAWVGDDKTKTS